MAIGAAEALQERALDEIFMVVGSLGSKEAIEGVAVATTQSLTRGQVTAGPRVEELNVVGCSRDHRQTSGWSAREPVRSGKTRSAPRVVWVLL